MPFYVDGIYQPQMVALFFDLNNIERVEVLRGPQGTLYGRNATGGAVNIVTRDPAVEPSAEFSASYGSFDERIFSGYLTGGTGIVAADVALYYGKDNGYVRDVVRDERLAKRESLGVRTKLQFTPSDDSSFTFAYSYSDTSDNAGLAPQVINRNTISRATVPTVVIPTEPYEISVSFDPVFKTKQHAASFKGVINLPSFDLTMMSGFQDNVAQTFSDSDATAVNAATLRYNQFGQSWNQDLYLTSTTSGPFSWTLGATYFRDTSGYNPRFNTPLFTSRVKTDAVAVYAEGTLQLADAWSVTGGGRYSTETKQYTAEQGASKANGKVSFSSFKPSASIQFKPSSALNIYARYSEAFKAGVFNTSVISNRPVRPENVRQIELGLKARIVDGVRLEAAIYDTDYKNIQVTARDPLTGGTFLQNAASARLRGGEVQLTINPASGLNIRLGGSYIDAKYDSFPNAQAFVPRPTGGNVAVITDLSGNRLYKVPKWSGIAGFDYTADLSRGSSLTFAASASYTGKVFWDASNRLSESAYTLVNSSITWALPGDRFKVAIWGNNLLDETYFLSATSSPSADFGSFGRPRSVGVRVSLAFN